MAVEREAVLGHWVRAPEEEGARAQVFRPASHPLPPARGRYGFELREDGGLVERGPGPVDAPVESTGTWELRGDALVLRGAGGVRVLRVAAAEPDRLLVEPE